MFKKIFLWIKNFIDWDHSQCYDIMERRGYAAFGNCSGVVGGDVTTNYLCNSCMDCKYFVK